MRSIPVRAARRLQLTLLLPAVLIASVVALGPAQAQPDSPLPPSELTVGSQLLATADARLSAVATPNDGTSRLFVADKDGRVLEFDLAAGEFAAEPVLDISDRVFSPANFPDDAGNEQGLLGVAPSPNFADDQTVFISYTATGTTQRRERGALTVSRFELGGADPAGTEQVVLRQEHFQNNNHNGGDLQFGPDGYLYWSTGDGGSNRDPFYGAQNLSALLGKIVRIDVARQCDGRQYCIPRDNPFARGGIARPEIWAYGLRNPWRFAFDAENESLWIGDVGQNRFEEVNHAPLRPRPNGWSFGWSCKEGLEFLDGPETPNPFLDTRCLPGARYVDPVFTYATGEAGRCAVMGGVVYRGREFADIADGTFVATDYCTGDTWGIQEHLPGQHRDAPIGSLPVATTAFGEDADGEVYFVTDAARGGAGELYKLTFDTTADLG